MKKLLVFSLIAMLAVPAFTQEEASSDANVVTTTTTQDIIYNQGDVSIDAGIDTVTKYFFRGLLVEDQGFILQPYATINFHVVSGCDVEFTLFTGVWASLHGEDVENGVADDPELLNELDFYFGGVLNLYDLLTITTTYTIFTFPNQIQNQEDIHEFSVHVGLNDGELTGNKSFTINPFFLFAYELHDANANANNVGDEGAIILFGVKPTVAVNLMPDVDLELSLPVTVGFGANNNTYVDAQNRGHSYGYTSVGLEMALPLFFIPERLGRWKMVSGVDVLFLSEAAEDTNDDDEIDAVAKFGIHMSY